MRIQELYLKNSAHIYSGLGKYEIHLDFSKSNKVINVIIGKIGSCKTIILGHLQPFATLGTLDNRNQDNVILAEKNGEKRISYKDGDDIFEISHKYTWIKDHHTTKSYFKKNGEELNPSGNASSFKTYVEIELGMDQNYLRLLRLGPNVVNLIDQKTTDRKASIAYMLSNVDVYALIHKKLTEELRNANAQATVLTSRINSIPKDDIDKLRTQLNINRDRIDECMDTIREIQEASSSDKALLDSILKGKSISSYKESLNKTKLSRDELCDEYTILSNDIDRAKDVNMLEISKQMGALDNQLSKLLNEKILIEQSLDDEQNNYNSLKEKSLLQANDEHKKILLSTFNESTDKYNEYKSKLKNFDYKYNSNTVINIKSKIQTVDLLISEIYEYKREIVLKLLSNGAGEIAKSKKLYNILIGKKINLQKKLNNVKFVGKYEPLSYLYTGPGCSVHNACPYYITHPYTLQKNKKDSDLLKETNDILSQIDAIDADIDNYGIYPIVYAKIKTLRSIWPSLANEINEIGALRTNNIFSIFASMNTRVWYDYDKISNVLELCIIREKSYELDENLRAMQSKLNSLNDNVNLDALLNDSSNKLIELNNQLNKNNLEVLNTKQSIKNNDELYSVAITIDAKKNKAKEISEEISKMNDKIDIMTENMAIVSDKESIIKELELRYIAANELHKELYNKNQKINVILNDIRYAEEDYEKISGRIHYLKLLQEACSSSKGIPLVFIKLFLSNCIDIVNDLISDVFGDTIEILDFNITDTDFTIPYSKNGIIIDDISRASQGQQSIISLALSFALMREGNSKYNIPLLDEMDGSLYKSDREKFISILFKQINAIGAEQIFVVSHNNTFNGQNVNIIMTTDEDVEESSQITVMHV